MAFESFKFYCPSEKEIVNIFLEKVILREEYETVSGGV